MPTKPKAIITLRKVEELQEEVRFWKAETLECRNVLADIVNDRGALEKAAISGGTLPGRRFGTEADRLFGAAQKYAASFAKAEKKKNPRRK